MTQASTNETFHRQTNQVEKARPVDANSVEFIPTTIPPDLTTNAKRVWVDQVNETLNFTVDGIDFFQVTANGQLGFVNVKSPPFNARGNGIADDTIAIQAAIAFANSNNLTVYFPKGIYRISNTLLMETGTKFVGEGKRKTIIRTITAIPAIKVNGTNLSSVLWWEIDGITLDGNGVGTIGLQLEFSHEGSYARGMITGFQKGITFNQSFSNDITTSQIFSNSDTNVELGSQSNDITLLDCQFDLAGNYGVHVTAESQGISLISCVVQRCGKDGVLVDDGSGINISGGYFESNNTSLTAGVGDIRLSGSVGSVFGTAITGTQIWTRWTQAGIVINDASGVSIQGCSINNVGGGTTTFSIQTSTSTVDGSVILSGNLLVDPINDLGLSIVDLKTPVFRNNLGVKKNAPNIFVDTLDATTAATNQQYINGVLRTELKTDTDGQVYFNHALTAGTLQEVFHVTGTNRVEWSQTLDMNLNLLVSPRLVLNGGTTAGRPASPATFEEYYDTTIGKPIWYNGTNWKDATGATV